MSFVLQKDTHPPTGVDHCLECHFFSSAETNLLVVQSTELLVYKLCLGDSVCMFGHYVSHCTGLQG